MALSGGLRAAWVGMACVMGATTAWAQTPVPPPPPDAPPPSQAVAAPAPEASTTTHVQQPHEALCDDRLDNDSDHLTDCADSDCYANPVCKPGNANENSDARCTDWIDNDGDHAIDCDDDDCFGPGLTACSGSLDRERAAQEIETEGPGANQAASNLRPNQSMEELIGTQGDLDGERTDEVCADGVDNDSDGRKDCADFGCRFDPSVTVCSGKPTARFSVVAGMGLSWDRTYSGEGIRETTQDARFTRLQLRAMGNIPFIQNSFFLINLRAERSPRLTFAMFQVPIKGNHYFNVNSGSGSLSTALIISTSRQLMLDPASYVYNAFEQGNGGAIEVGGPLVPSGRLRYRVFGAAGSGEFNGNVGGRFFRSDDQNFTWTAGAQLAVNIVGNFSRFDNPFLYTPVPLTVGLLVGGKYDQRAVERYPATNIFFVARWNRFLFSIENYSKRELTFGSWQTAYVAQFAYLLIPKWLLIAADAGQYYSTSMVKPPVSFSSSTVARPLNEWQVRGAMHVYVYRNIGLASVVYTERHIEKNPDRIQDPVIDRQVRLEGQFRF